MPDNVAKPHLLRSLTSAPLDDPTEDRLGRREFAHRVYRILIDCPPDWPVRVGLLGEWGEGKTTVANYVRRFARGDGHLVVEYPVSSKNTVEDLWTGFAIALCEAIEEARLLVEPHLLPFRRLDLTKVMKKGDRRVEAATELVGSGAGMLSGAPQFAGLIRGSLAGGINLLRELIGVDERTVSAIRKAIPETHRIIVVLDDVDRADPRIVPELLLRLRDLLDIPQFSFLIPCDPNVVIKSLGNYHLDVVGTNGSV